MLEFQEWIKFIFDRPAFGDEKCYVHEDKAIAIPDEQALEFMTKIFTGCSTLLRSFSDDQVAFGLSYLTDPSVSNYILITGYKHIALEQRTAFLYSLENLYRDCFNLRCKPLTAPRNGSEPLTPSPLNDVCYMLFDVSPIPHLLASVGKKKKKSGDSGQRSVAVQKVFESILELTNTACIESALHGLGHAHLYAPVIVESIIDNFLNQKRDHLPDWLVAYALNARQGRIE